MEMFQMIGTQGNTTETLGQEKPKEINSAPRSTYRSQVQNKLATKLKCGNILSKIITFIRKCQ